MVKRPLTRMSMARNAKYHVRSIQNNAGGIFTRQHARVAKNPKRSTQKGAKYAMCQAGHLRLLDLSFDEWHLENLLVADWAVAKVTVFPK